MVDPLSEPVLAPAVEPRSDAPPMAAAFAALPQTAPDAVLTTVRAPDLQPPGGDRSQSGPASVPLITDSVIAAPERDLPATDPSAIRIGRRTPIAVPGFGAPPVSPPASPAAELDDYFEKLDAAFATLQQAPPKPESPGVSGAPAIALAFSALLAAEHGEAIPGEGATVAATSPLSPEALDELVSRVTSEVVERMSDRLVRDMVTDVVSRIAEKLVREEIDRVKATIK
jgi:cell pole-organizing protein PopZ